MDLFDNLYSNVKYVEILRHHRRIKAYVVTYGEEDWAGAYFKTKDKAYKFTDFLRSKNAIR